jgi:uncharacterized membrane protein YfbV (UPF0208 family)
MSQSVAIISAATALLALVLAIFGASWLNQRNIERLLDARFETVLSEIRRLDQRINSLEQRLDRIERQLEAVFKPVLPPRA